MTEQDCVFTSHLRSSTIEPDGEHASGGRQGVQVVGGLAQLVHGQGEGLWLVAGFGVAA